MTSRPSYAVHEVLEKDITVDWFFGRGHTRAMVGQAVLLVAGWFFLVLPIVITGSALLHRDDDGGWWSYQEGFDLWDQTVLFLSALFVIFVLGFLGLHLVDRVTLATRNRQRTYDEHRLALRMQIADAWYAEKYGPQSERLRRRHVEIGPYSDIETYELRGLYRANQVD